MYLYIYKADILFYFSDDATIRFLSRAIETEISKWEKRWLDRGVLDAIVKAHLEYEKAEK